MIFAWIVLLAMIVGGWMVFLNAFANLEKRIMRLEKATRNKSKVDRIGGES